MKLWKSAHAWVPTHAMMLAINPWSQRRLQIAVSIGSSETTRVFFVTIEPFCGHPVSQLNEAKCVEAFWLSPNIYSRRRSVENVTLIYTSCRQRIVSVLSVL